MDPLVQMIVDILRRGKENTALNQGGPMAGASPQASPEMLGSGGAAMAGEALMKRKTAPMQTVDSLQ